MFIWKSKKVLNEFNKNRNYKTDNLTFDTYKKLTGVNPDIKTKIVLLVNELHKSNLQIMDLLSYLLILKDSIYSEDELDYNINFCIIRENLENNRVKPVIILTVNNEDYYKDNNKYFILDDKISEIDEESLKNLFNNKKYEYIENTKYKIPKISENNVNMRLYK